MKLCHQEPRADSRVPRAGMRGQSLVETAFMLPLLIMIVLNIVNLAYFFLMTIQLTGTSRTGALYSIMGSSTPVASPLPDPGAPSAKLSVAYVAWGDMSAFWGTQATNLPSGVTMQICSGILGINSTGAGTTSQVANCDTCDSSGCSATSGSPSPTLDADPEAPNFVLNQVAVTYQFNALFPGKLFNIPLQAFSGICNSSGACTFTRTVEMRAMN